MNDKPRVGVLMGGPAGEREISFLSGQAVAAALESRGYPVIRVEITERLAWSLAGGAAVSATQAGSRLLETCDVLFPALHGRFGEDGTLQGFFETVGLRYVGNGVAASALAMNKDLSRRIAASLGVAVPEGRVGPLRCSDQEVQQFVRVAGNLGMPLFVKPTCAGSSVGVSRVEDLEDLADAIRSALAEGGRVLVEKAVHGVELSCPVLEGRDGVARALPVIEIVPKMDAFFDYHAKYTVGMTDEICPARLDPELACRVQEQAVLVHQEFGCRSLSRSDFILDGETPVFLELNTMPGLTSVSLFPKAAEQEGISYAELCEQLVLSALRG
ncbi:MAG: D-alanine--D-alanine ligase [Planctomycetota bacterium]